MIHGAKDVVGAVLDGFRQWLRETGKPPGEIKEAVDEARLLLELMRDHLDVERPDTLAADGWDDTDEDAGHDPAALAQLLSEAIPPGQEPVAFETMARLPHPQVASVLTVIGRLHPDKRIAKAARKAAYKASTRQMARRT